MNKECTDVCGKFSSREELIYDFVKKNGGDAERAKAFVLYALPYLDGGFFSREEFLENLFINSYARIAPEDFWPAYDAYMAKSKK